MNITMEATDVKHGDILFFLMQLAQVSSIAFNHGEIELIQSANVQTSTMGKGQCPEVLVCVVPWRLE